MTGRATKARRARYRQWTAEPERVKRFEARMARLTDVSRREHADKRWCILRTSSRSTVALLDDLEAAGFDVWTPTQIIERRAGRARDRVERCTAMMPSFLFAAAADAPNLLRLSAQPAKGCAEFTVFHYRERVPLILDRDIAALRRMEVVSAEQWEQERERKRRHAALTTERARRAALRNSTRPLPAGSAVDMPHGAFEGMPGLVVTSDRGMTTVDLGGFWKVQIETFLLSGKPLQDAQP